MIAWTKLNPRADLDGIERGGYKLVYKDKPSASEKTMSSIGGRRGGGVDCWYSLGMRISGEGIISDLRWNGPADKAHLAPGQKIIAINGQVFSAELLHEAIKAAKGNTEPIKLILQSDTYVSNAGDRLPRWRALPCSGARGRRACISRRHHQAFDHAGESCGQQAGGVVRVQHGENGRRPLRTVCRFRFASVSLILQRRNHSQWFDGFPAS